MLDGNAVLDAMKEIHLEEIGESPPLIVMSGYAMRTRFDLPARAYDYTSFIERNAE
jgi:predicted alpha/beta superfamily hydrolase